MEGESIDDERARVEKDRIEELKEANAEKLKDHRRPEQGERLEYKGLRIGPECGQPCCTDEERDERFCERSRVHVVLGMRHILRFDSHISK